MGKTTCIRQADWVIAWDEGSRRHVYVCEADVVFEDDTIVFVGRGYAGPVDTRVVKDHEVLNLDHTDALGRLAEAQARMETAVPDRDYAGRSALEIAPLSLARM